MVASAAPRASGGEDGHFACAGNGGLVQVVGEVGVTGDVGEDSKAASDEDNGHDGEAVKAVGEVDGVARTGEDEVNEGDEDPAHVPAEVFEERDDEGGFYRAGSAQVEPDGGEEGDEREQGVFVFGAQALWVFEDEFAVVVNPADGTEAEHDEEGDPGVFDAQIRPEQHGDADAEDDERAAHCRCAGFFQVGLRAIVADVLPHLQAFEESYHRAAAAKREKQGGEGAEDDARGEVGKGVERGDVAAEPFGEGVEHGRLVLGVGSVDGGGVEDAFHFRCA